MAMISCPKCGKMVAQGGFYTWQILVAICLFPLGLLALLGGRQPTKCYECGHTFQS